MDFLVFQGHNFSTAPATPHPAVFGVGRGNNFRHPLHSCLRGGPHALTCASFSVFCIFAPQWRQYHIFAILLAIHNDRRVEPSPTMTTLESFHSYRLVFVHLSGIAVLLIVPLAPNSIPIRALLHRR